MMFVNLYEENISKNTVMCFHIYFSFTDFHCFPFFPPFVDISLTNQELFCILHLIHQASGNKDL